MSRKTMMATALAACLAVLFFAVQASDRNRRQVAERTQRGPLTKETEKTPLAALGAGYIRELDPVATDETWAEPDDNPMDVDQFLNNLSAVKSAQLLAMNFAMAEQLLRQSERQDGTEAIGTLRRVLRLKLADTPETKQIQSEANLRLAQWMDVPARQQYHLQQAYLLSTDSARRAEIEARILAAGGSIPIPTQAVARGTRNFGPDDQCSNSIPVGLPGSVTMSIQTPISIPGTGLIEDRNFVTFDVAPPAASGSHHHQHGTPMTGAIVEIETTAGCSTEAECSAPQYDTLIRLYGACASDGQPELMLQGDDEGGVAADSGLGWLSALNGSGACIDDTGRHDGDSCFIDSECKKRPFGTQSHGFCNNPVCLPPGTYYIEAMGEFGAAPQNFNVSVRQIGSCPIPGVDSYEPDDAGVDAKKIGWSSSQWSQSVFRAFKEIQGHTILAAGTAASIDIDHVKIELSRDEIVKFSTAITQPDLLNGFFYRPATQDTDTQMQVQYADGISAQAGVCNHNSAFRGGSFVDMGCKSSATNFDIVGLGPDEDPNGCVAGVAPRFFNVPSNWCVPNYMVNFLTATASGIPNFLENNPFMFHDDNNPGAADYGSTIELCLPQKDQATLPTNPVVAEITSSAANPRSPLNNYFYEIRGQTLTPCRFEREPNNSPFEASPVVFSRASQDVYGISDTSETRRTNVILPVMRCSTLTTQRCYAAPRPAGPNRFAGTIVDTCPNDALGTPGTCTVAPLESAVTTGGFHDIDYWSFNVERESTLRMTLTPTIIDPHADTELFLRVGPADTDGDGFDDFPIVVQDPDTVVPVSEITVAIPPAAEYLANLGIPGQDPQYFLVASHQTNRAGDDGSSIANFYYKLSFVTVGEVFPEVEPGNNDCLTTPQVPLVGDAYTGALSPSGGKRMRSAYGIIQDCDIDAYRISLTENTRMTFEITGDPAATDTTIQLESCDTGTKLACDEDGQFDTNGTYWSLIQGCLPPGNYCLRVRAWSGFGPEFFGLNEFYKISFNGTPGCDPSSDPVVGDENASSCIGPPPASRRGPFDSFCDGDLDGYPGFTACGQPR